MTRVIVDALRAALVPYGIDRIGVAPAVSWDARAPAQLSIDLLFPEARSVVVIGNAGRGLWSAFRRAVEASDTLRSVEHPLDAFVAQALDRCDEVLALHHVRARRFDPTYASFVSGGPQIDFRTLGELTGLGALGPFGLLIDREHGPWWALRGAWLVDAELEPTGAGGAPCSGCPAPCVSASGPTSLDRSTAAMRDRCPLGRTSRYDDEAIAYHHDGIVPRWLVRGP